MYDQEYTVSNQTMLAGGVNHKAYLGKNWNINSTIAASYFKNDGDQSYYDGQPNQANKLGHCLPYIRMRQNNSQFTATTNVQKRFSLSSSPRLVPHTQSTSSTSTSRWPQR